MSLSPHLKRAGHIVKLVEAERGDLSEVAETYRPDIVGYSVCTGSERYYFDLNRFLKTHWKFVAVFGGPHPTFFPDMISEPGVDAICRGEGDLAFAEFCEKMQTHGCPMVVPNFTIKTDAGISSLPPRPLVADLNSLPGPDRDLYYSVSSEIESHTIRSFLASRGCTFACTYCFNPSMDSLYMGNWRHVRVRSPHDVVEEIVEVVARYPTEFVAFRESIFPLDDEWLRIFADAYAKRVGLPFYCHLRLDLLNHQNVAQLARAGCYSANVGIETGNEEIRRRLLRRPMSNEIIVSRCKLLHDHGIRILANNMLALPGTTFEHDLETLRLNQECQPDYALAMLWQPYPGTALTQYAKEHGYYRGDGSDLDFTYYNHSHLSFADTRDKQRVENFQKLFAVAVAVPWLTPVIKILISLSPNRVFKAIFQTMYLVFHQTEIFRHRMTFSDWMLNIRHIAKET